MNQTFNKHATQLLMLLSLTLIIVILFSFNNRESEQPKWQGNDHFKITQDESTVKVRMSKMPWESFSVDIQDLESAEGFLSFEVKSATDISLRVDGLTTDNTQIELLQEEISAGSFQNVLYSISSSDARINHLIFYVNAGEIFHGELQFKGLTVQPYSEEGNIVSVFPNPTVGDVLVQLPHPNFTHLTLFDDHGNVVLSKQPDGARGVKLSLNGRKPGLYVLKARSTNELLTTKVILK
jgi:hypothetical protein